MIRTLTILSLLSFPIGCLAGGPLEARPSGPVKWTFTAGADSSLHVELTALCEEGWHIYAMELPRDDGPLPTLIRTSTSPAFRTLSVVEPQAEEVDDPNFGMRVRYHSGTFTYHVFVERLTPEAFEVAGEVEFMACNDRTCLPPEVVKFSISVPASK